ncbi:head-tail joining protein [Paracoccus tibetensis]|uniref:Uncharacterized protein n=1 Tax=Paracoccus tibetensis TaxID=336292 RepID=A0A1G5HCV5_9RHOB|nr:hypothetical protein [Paracoccus tibetensis]SCY61596.1 hypothetical protein SAMN05660710_02110 [Paracoccus tibetensis]
MTRIFDGLAGTLAGVLGEPVEYAPRVGLIREIQSIFRESPIEVTGADGQAVLIEAPTWRVSGSLAPELARGDLIRVPDGRRFSVTTVHKSGSPAADAFVIAELHLLEG